MFYQCFLSLQVKRMVIIRNKHGIYEFSNDLPNDMTLDLRKLGNIKISKLQGIIVQRPRPSAPPPKPHPRRANPSNTHVHCTPTPTNPPPVNPPTKTSQTHCLAAPVRTVAGKQPPHATIPHRPNPNHTDMHCIPIPQNLLPVSPRPSLCLALRTTSALILHESRFWLPEDISSNYQLTLPQKSLVFQNVISL